MASEITLFYYDAKGRAEVLRLLLAAAGQKYKTILISFEDWPTEKKNTPFGQLPVIEVNGEKFAQTVAIANYIAKETGFYGKTPLECLRIDQIVQTGIDLLNLAVPAFQEKDETIKAEKMKHFTEVDATRFFGIYEAQLKKTGTGYFVGKSLTLADFFIYDQVFTPSKWKNFNTDAFPLLQALRQKVESHEKIKAYLATRKVTEF
uniref:Glutathione transferase n=1 Tax=Arion vulgaris TaxID=1028688 RepID=A0A0B7AD39_9EUPU